MAKDTKAFYEKQISLSEWFENLGYKDTENFRLEDNEKRQRLSILNQFINLPFDRPTQFPAIEISQRSPDFADFLNKRGDELCALRLIPLNPKLPKLRNRGLSIKDAVEWFATQQIDPKLYKADFVPHSEKPLWSTIFIINSGGIFGEIIAGMHSQLTQGFYEENEPISFIYDFKKLRLSHDDKQAYAHVKKVLDHLRVNNEETKKILVEKLNAKFIADYLVGYFETIEVEEFGLWFIDYNRSLGENFNDFTVSLNDSKIPALLTGKSSMTGKARGKVKIVLEDEVDSVSLNEQEILVCKMTTPEYLPLMKKAVAIITDLGGILSHAAIISRELKVPCISGTKTATQTLKNGDLIEVDAGSGHITLLG